jgi:uncharacterized integral membrane protein
MSHCGECCNPIKGGKFVRIAVIILVVIGSLLTMSLGAKWIFDYNDGKQTVEELKQDVKSLGVDTSSLDEIEDYKTDGYVVLVCGFLALVSVFLIRRFGKFTAVMMLLAGIVPAFVDPGALIFTFFVLLGGVLCFFVKPKQPKIKTVIANLQ